MEINTKKDVSSMKSAKKIILPEEPMSFKDYMKIKNHIRNSIVFYAVNLRSPKKKIVDAMARKGLPVGRSVDVIKTDGSVEAHDISSEELEALTECGVVDDESLCVSKAHRLFRRKVSRRKAENSLYRSGFTKEVYTPILDSIYSSEAESDSAYDVTCKNMRMSSFSKLNTEFEKRNFLVSKLLSLGFNFSIAKSAVDRALSDSTHNN